MSKYLITLLFLTVSFGGVAQSNENLLEQAMKYYENEQFREALNLLDKYILTDSSNANSFKIRGNCYSGLNLTIEARLDYRKAILIDPQLSDAYYNLASILEQNNILDSSEFYFRKYISLNNSDPEGFIRLGYNLQLQGVLDSTLMLYEKAYALDSTNIMCIYYMAQEHFILGNFEKTIELSEKGKQLDSLDLNFYFLHAYSALNLSEHETALDQTNLILAYDSLNFNAITLKIEATILSNTSPELIHKDNFHETKFNHINSLTFNELLGRDSVNYEDFLMKAKQGEVLSLDQYFKFYIFQSQEKNYSPYYPKTNPKIAEYWDDQNFMELSKFTHEVLNMNPFNLDDLYKISVANYMMREMEGFHSLYSVYFGIMQSILASGNGHTYDSAYVVVSTADEYLILNYLELGSKGQSLIYSDGHNYDILNSVDEFENEQEVYFNIDLPFNHLGSSFSDSSPKKKKKKRKNGL